ncbi:MAG: hypothetical protein M3440_11095 [Chloroflexota bacterium]|nr:hypothetical protein [Chloroflexota bacterium]
MAEKTERMEDRIVLRSDPEFIARVQRVADERFGTNRSLLVRRAIERLIEPIEVELAERDANELQAA